jgi:thioredoxin reductase
METKDVVIIGAGPAGIAAAIQLKRYRLEPILLEKDEIGGLLRNANLVENYPGFPGGINGLKLVDLFKQQAIDTGVKVSKERVVEVDYLDNVFETRTDRRSIKSSYVVIASGTKPKKLPFPPLSRGLENRTRYEVYPILGLENKKIVILGASDAAFDYALSLSQKNKVTILNRSSQTKCIPVLKERCKKSLNITYMSNVNVREIKNGNDQVVISCFPDGTKEPANIYSDYLVIAIGREPALDFLSSGLKTHYNKLLKSNRLLLIGDVKNEIYRQTAICAGDGIKAAMNIFQQIRSESNENHS